MAGSTVGREQRTAQARLEDFAPPPEASQTPPAQQEGQAMQAKGPTP
jgi:hypothetical protein